MNRSGPNCFECQHFFITWDKNFPRGCRANGIKTSQLPATEVLMADGRPCLQFRPKKNSKVGKRAKDNGKLLV